ncbi:MAG: histidine kinase [Prolixibacteraceae bacterium]|jgi:hypothetical protein|nr:histidine kinase [Prolixibacteraceae bacterium]MBT6006416.1 histidine kinase [Prolixibacteraceae bacterium]MBT6763032.1 histidine kinase [Prolixibacteraceae bacterium]MBT6998421.1 histidine kinase [Prolixibacteraceae bacterium]MBT7397035.1 histidine kinase [Prolixibacteraceae bacterium]
MTNSSKIRKGEILIYIVIWLVVLLMPVFLFQNSNGSDWTRISREWTRIFPFLLIFLVHNFLLFPVFFVPRKNLSYFSLTLILIIGVSVLMMVFGKKIDLPLGALPMERPPGRMPGLEAIPAVKPKPWQMMILENVLISILVVGFNAAIKLTIKWQDEEQKNKELEKEKLQTELAFLKNQVSPHFFMNTLNNIHALIDINSEDAKNSIIKLSKLMRYLLYDSEEGKTTLAKEIEFIKSYVDLMKLRFTSKVRIQLSFPENIPEIEIPPMLFTSLVENSFKHGVSYQSDSFIEIIMNANKEFLFFRIRNSKQKGGNGIIELGGIGLENLKKRLNLIYGNKFSIIQNENDEAFEINIKLPLNEN